MEQQERRSLRVRTLQQTILEVTALNPDEAYVAHAPLLDGLDPRPWPARDQRRVHAPSRASGWQLPQTAAIKTLDRESVVEGKREENRGGAGRRRKPEAGERAGR